MNFKQFGVLLSVSAVLGMNFIPTKALTQKPSIKFGQAIASGGCNVGDQLVGSDGRTLSIVFDNMHAENGSRQSCILRVNTTIPSGFYVQDMRILYQGSTEVPSGSKGTSLSRSYIFNGGALGQASARPATTKFTSSNELFQVEDPITVASASCGGEGQLGINMIVQSSPGTSIVVGSPDLAGRDVEIHVDLDPC
jgi:hypothetical protein